MDVISAIQVAAYTSGIGMQAVVGVAVTTALLCMELPSRFENSDAVTSALTPRKIFKGCAHVALRCVPEVTGVTFVTGAALLLRMYGPEQHNTTPLEHQAWAQILKEWPICHGADTLLGLQAMLRLLVFFAVVCRIKPFMKKHVSPPEEEKEAKEMPPPPMAGMPAVFFLAAMLARNYMHLGSKSYWLDGPLGQGMEVMYETAMVPLLASLAFTAMKKTPVTAAAAVGAATMWASQHYLNLAQNPSVDRLFTLSHVFEILAAVTLLYKAGRSFFEPKCSRFDLYTGFFYIMMPLQQCLATYYFIAPALQPDYESIGGGRPWCLLIMGNLLAFGCYILAFALWLASYFVNRDNNHDGSAGEVVSARRSVNSQPALQTNVVLDDITSSCHDNETASQCTKRFANLEEGNSQLAGAVYL